MPETTALSTMLMKLVSICMDILLVGEISGKGDFRPFLDWYQLVEACEWLYEDTKYTEYRDLALKYAKICQVLRPLYGWPYAVEAK